MKIRKPFNLSHWIAENSELLKPPVGNKNLYNESEDYIVMVVGGPNARKDFHYNQTEELFYQLKGNIVLKIYENDALVEVPICEGEMYLLPATIPHSPIRPTDTVGLVIERKRTQAHKDGLLWYCDSCHHLLHETYFHLKNIEKDFFPRFRAFYNSETLRTCKNCGEIMEKDTRFVD